MYQPAPDNSYQEKKMSAMKDVIYLNSILSCSGNIDAVVNKQLHHQSQQWLRRAVWEWRGMSQEQNLKSRKQS